jgi:hypothetical protein
MPPHVSFDPIAIERRIIFYWFNACRSCKRLFNLLQADLRHSIFTYDAQRNR